MGGVDIEVVEGDITGVDVDAVVTAANSWLAGGGGVDGAVHAAAGPELVQASLLLAPCAPGQAVVTPAFGLRTARWVVHAVGPVWSGGEDGEPGLLAGAYRAALARADEVGATSIAFPAISTGVYHYPRAQAAEVAVRTLQGARTSVRRCLLVAFDSATAALYRELLTP